MEPFIEGGYVLIRAVPRNEWMSQELLPAQLLSASSCISPHFPGTYALTWCQDDDARRAAGFERIGLAEELRASATAWATENFDELFGWPAVYYELADALAARDRFFPGDPGMYVIGLGLPEQYLAEFLDQEKPEPALPGLAPMGASGCYQILSGNQPLASGGQFLGFELLVADGGRLDHSWICSRVEDHCFHVLGIRPAPNGFLADFETAEQCLSEVRKKSVGAEPGLWLPWALFSYA